MSSRDQNQSAAKSNGHLRITILRADFERLIGRQEFQLTNQSRFPLVSSFWTKIISFPFFLRTSSRVQYIVLESTHFRETIPQGTYIKSRIKWQQRVCDFVANGTFLSCLNEDSLHGIIDIPHRLLFVVIICCILKKTEWKKAYNFHVEIVGMRKK